MANAEDMTGSGKSQAEIFFAQALDAHDANDLAAALDLYTKTIQADPTMELAYNNLGMVYIDMGNLEEAKRFLIKATETKPDYPEPYNNLGFVLRRMGDDVGAARYYLRYLELSPEVEEGDKIRTWADGVLALAGEASPAPAADSPSQPLAAAVSQDAATDTDPEAQSIFEEQDWLSEDSAEPQAASPAPEQSPASSIDADIADLIASLEEPSAEPAQPSSPQPASTPAAAQPAPDPAAEQLALASAAYDSGDFQRALALYDDILADNPAGPAALSGKGSALVKLGRFDEGIAVLQHGISIDPSAPGLYYILGFAYRSRGEDIEAADAYERYLDLAPDAEESGRMRAWIDEVRSAASMPPEERHYNAALTAFQEGALDKAFIDCEEALFINESHGPANLLLGRITIRNGDYIRAVAALRKAAEARPNDPEVFFYLGQAFEKRGLNEEARQAYEKVVEVAPEGPRAERVREWLDRARDSGEVSLGLRCEYCLKTFQPGELFDYQNKKACRECLSHLGISADDLLAPETEEDLPDVQWEDLDAIEETVEKPSCFRRLFKLAMVVLVLIILLLGAGVAVVRFNVVDKDWLEEQGINRLLRDIKAEKVMSFLGIDISTPGFNSGVNTGGDRHNNTDDAVSSIRFLSSPVKELAPCASLAYSPRVAVDGKGDVVYSLETAPGGASVNPDTGDVNWSPLDARIESLPFAAKFTLMCSSGDVSARQDFTVNVRFDLGKRFSFRTGNLDIPATDMLVADLNDDGLLDIAISYGEYARSRVSVFFRNTAVSFSGSKEFAAGGGTNRLAVADADSDGIVDLLALSQVDRRVQVYLQDPTTHMLGLAGHSDSWSTGHYPLDMCAAGDGSVRVLAQDEGGRMYAVTPRKAGAVSAVSAVPGPVSVFTRIVNTPAGTLFTDLPAIGAATVRDGKWRPVPGIAPPVRIIGRGGSLALADDETVRLIKAGAGGDPEVWAEFHAAHALASGVLREDAGGENPVPAAVIADGEKVGVFLQMGEEWVACPPVQLSARPVLPAFTSADGLVVLLLEDGEVWGIGRRE